MLKIIRYSDSDFIGFQDSMKFTIDYIFMLVGGAISYKSAKQSLSASSTMEAKFIACFQTLNQAM
jgi:hypothetical protein